MWIADVGAFARQQPALWAELDAAERARAERFHFARDRVQYVAAHGLLRRLLGAYVGLAGSRLRFVVGPWGKPALAREPDAAAPVTFNLSHSGDRVAIAVAHELAVGVDVERWSDDIVYDELADAYFSPAERAALRALQAGEKQRAFFAGWSRKEAYLKALGVGVSRGLDSFDVSLTPGVPVRLLADRLGPATAGGWTLFDLDLEDGYSGAVAANAAVCRVECRTLTPSAKIDESLIRFAADPVRDTP